MSLVGANSKAPAVGVARQTGVVSYFFGNDPKQWRTGIPTYGKVDYAEVYPGVDLVFYGNQRELEYDFVVAPGADPGRIAWRIEGARASVDAQRRSDAERAQRPGHLPQAGGVPDVGRQEGQRRRRLRRGRRPGCASGWAATIIPSRWSSIPCSATSPTSPAPAPIRLARPPARTQQRFRARNRDRRRGQRVRDRPHYLRGLPHQERLSRRAQQRGATLRRLSPNSVPTAARWSIPPTWAAAAGTTPMRSRWTPAAAPMSPVTPTPTISRLPAEPTRPSARHRRAHPRHGHDSILQHR